MQIHNYYFSDEERWELTILMDKRVGDMVVRNTLGELKIKETFGGQRWVDKKPVGKVMQVKTGETNA